MNTERPQYVRIIDEELASRCATIREQTGCEGAFGFAYDVALKARARVASLEMESAAKDAAIAQKDATIKALGNALWDARQFGDEPETLCWCASPCHMLAWRNPKCEGKVAALRLAGVLK